MNKSNAAYKTKITIQSCIDACSHCNKECFHVARTHYLMAGGKHIESGHFRLLMNCSEICHTSTNFLLSNSIFHKKICAICAEVCEACAKSCEQDGGMEDCIRACRTCAESCRKVAA